jgi:hypothetical protein
VHFAPVVEEQLLAGAHRDVSLDVGGSSVPRSGLAQTAR